MNTFSSPAPFFGSPAQPQRGERRLLLITASFPPDQNIGALRWQKLARYVAEWGWGLDVIMVDPRDLPSLDPSRLADLPAGTRIFGVRETPPPSERLARFAWQTLTKVRQTLASLINTHRRGNGTADDTGEPTRASTPTRPGSLSRAEITWRAMSPRATIRAYHAWLDYSRTKRWAHDAVGMALRIIRPGVHEAVLTSGPPHMAHEGGRLVARATALPHVMDLRDPWSLVERLPEDLASPLWLALAKHYERRAIRHAALVATNTELLRAAMCKLYPEARDRVITVMNGCDDDPLPVSHDAKFRIAYAGDIYLDRDPRPVFRAAASVIAKLALQPSEFGIEFMGRVDSFGPTPVRQIAADEGIEAFLTLHPPRPRREALDFLARATLLVSLPQDSHMAIPGKIFEYLRCDAWVLALTRDGSATSLLLRDTPACVVAPNDAAAIASVIHDRVLAHRRGVRPCGLGDDPRFSRRAQAERLLAAIAAVTRRASAHPRAQVARDAPAADAVAKLGARS